MWNVFLCDSIDVEAYPIFYQFVSDSTLEELLKLNFPVQSSSRNTVSPIDYMEANAIRYVAGYVFRSVKKKCMKSAHPLKDAIILCLSDIEEDIGKNIFSSVLVYIYTLLKKFFF